MFNLIINYYAKFALINIKFYLNYWSYHHVIIIIIIVTDFPLIISIVIVVVAVIAIFNASFNLDFLLFYHILFDYFIRQPGLQNKTPNRFLQ